MADFYLTIHTDLMTLRELKSGTEVSQTGKFSTSRILIGDFYLAEFIVRQLVTQLGFHVTLPFIRSHNIVVQPLSQSEGGLSDVEERVILEVVSSGFNNKTKKLIISQNEHPLTDQQLHELLAK